MDHQPPAGDAHYTGPAWELAAKRDLDDRELRQLLELADIDVNTAQNAQNPCHEQRALTLVTIAHLRSGEAQPAQTNAERAVAMCRQNADQQTALDRACTLAAAAKAFNASGKSNEAFSLIVEALSEADKLGEAERDLFDRLFAES